MKSRTSILCAAGALLTAGLGLRIWIGLAHPSWYWNDQVFQTLEPAHWWVFGYGQIPWEFQEGLRNWIFPGLLGLVMSATEPLGPGSYGYLTGCITALSLLSLAPAAAAFAWGDRGRAPGALLALFVPLIWMELVYFAPKALYEVFAAHLLVAGIYLGRFPRGRRTRAVVGGALVGIACVSRLQLVPGAAAAVLVLPAVADNRHERFSTFVLGALGGLAAGGALDAITWNAPFQSLVVNYHTNLVEGRAAQWGTSSSTAYLRWMWRVSPPGAVLLLGATALGLVLQPALAWPAVALLAAHSAVGHKEYRFLYPYFALAVPVVGIQAGRLVEWVRRSTRSPGWTTTTAVAVAAAVAGLSGAAAADFRLDSLGKDLQQLNWDRRRGILMATRRMSTRPDVCGLAIPASKQVGGYTYLHRNIPILALVEDSGIDELTPYADAIVVDGWSRDRPPPDPYHVESCVADTCTLERPGPCQRAPEHLVFDRKTRRLEATGGTGGSEFQRDCPEGHLVGGVAGRLHPDGNVVGSLRPRCRRLERRGDRLWSRRAEGSERAEQRAKGEDFELTCPRGEVGVGLTGRSGARLDRIGVLCGAPRAAGWGARITFDSISSTETVGGTGGGQFRLRCPDGTALAGLAGRDGLAVDAVRLRCAPVTDLPRVGPPREANTD